ncbi:MAG: hypothetical protein A2X49_07825 [Lentisphaerae bacterium GWF2_52_8]|nr:MAG: hypothetical protein A2X49_07825 [Lentisphaerae bacterium GWF2_52_8]
MMFFSSKLKNDMEQKVFYRVDDRLVHGQVLIGWVKRLNIAQVIIANDNLVKDDLQVSILKMSMPQDITVKILDIDRFIEKFREGIPGDLKTMVLVESLEDIFRIVSGNIKMDFINIGGLHFKNGRKDILHSIYLNREEMAILEELEKMHIDIDSRALPTDDKIDIMKYIRRIPGESV